MKDALRILDLQPGATLDEIKASYRRLVKIHHPDLSDDKDAATRRMVEINSAFTFLVNQPGGKAANSDAKPSQTSQKPEPKSFWDEFCKAQWGETADSVKPAEGDEIIKQAFQRFGWHLGQPKKAKKTSAKKPSADDGKPKADNAAKAPEAPKIALKLKLASSSLPVDALAMNEDQIASLTHALVLRVRQEAFALTVKSNDGNYSMFNGSAFVRPDQMPGFHLCDAIRFEGRMLHVHLRSAAQVGRNIIALPHLVQIDDKMIQICETIGIYCLTRDKAGAQTARLSLQTGIVKDGRDFAITVHFGAAPSTILNLVRDEKGFVRFRSHNAA
jgi:curved DNA-binding protein CbpA